MASGQLLGSLEIYTPIQQVTDTQPIRATCFHPSGESYVVGTNSKELKICRYPDRRYRQRLIDGTLNESNLTNNNQSLYSAISGQAVNSLPVEPEIFFTCLHIHSGSVYCANFNQAGDLLATGSNDQIVHIIKYSTDKQAPDGSEYKLAIHSGTVRDVCFLTPAAPNTDEWAQSPSQQKSTNLLASAGAGDYEINVTDCNVMKCIHSFKGHEATVMSLHASNNSSNLFVSGSTDETIRLWDLRCKTAISVIKQDQQQSVASPIRQVRVSDSGINLRIEQNYNENNGVQQEQQRDVLSPINISNNSNENVAGQEEGTEKAMTTTTPPSKGGKSVGCVRLDPSGRLLVSGHLDGSMSFYDLRGGKTIQTIQAHEGEIRTLNFSPKSYYILSGGYDRKVKLMDIQGDLGGKLAQVEVAELGDKCVQTAWHPFEFDFVTTCANGSATLWTLPEQAMD